MQKTHPPSSFADTDLQLNDIMGPVVITISGAADSRYVEVSDYFLRITGYAREEVLGRTSMELHVWNDEKDRETIIEALQKTGVVRDRPLQFRSKQGEIILMLYSAEIISIGEVPHIVSVAVDLTERQKALEERERLENQLRQARKMESIGRLAGGVAHDFNNLLTAIMGNTDMAMGVTEPGGKIRSRLEVIRKASESAADLTRQLLAFSRKQFIEPKVINLNGIIRYMTKMLARMIGENIRLTTNIHTPAAKVMADPGQIEQIIVNLVVNARDAMPRGGRVMMEVGEVKQNNGSIEVYSSPGQGTSFKIYFPKVLDEQAEVLAADNMQDVVCGGSETILLVEDDSLVREFALDALRRLGYHVIEAASAEEALSLSGDFGKEIHLLLSDVILPGMNGKALADALTILRPDTRVLFTSGYTGDIIAHHGILKEGIAFIEKPYTISSLSKKIRKIL
ncbi:MAG: PAS domain S-box protein [Desulfosalsimonadaceae bacterium]